MGSACLSDAVPKIQWASDPHRQYNHLTMGHLYPSKCFGIRPWIDCCTGITAGSNPHCLYNALETMFLNTEENECSRNYTERKELVKLTNT